MLPLLILGGSVLAVFTAPKAAAGAILANHALGGFKAKEEARVLKEVEKTKLDPNESGRLVKVGFPQGSLPEELSFLEGDYYLTDEERAVFTQVVRGLDGGELPDLDIQKTIQSYKERTGARVKAGLVP